MQKHVRDTMAGVLLFAFSALGHAPPAGDLALPDILPASVIACVEPPDGQALEQSYANSVIRALADMPEMAPFFDNLAASRRALADDMAAGAGITRELAAELIEGMAGGALINVTLAGGGPPVPEYVLAVSLASPPDRGMVFDAVRNLLNRRDIVRAALKSQGLDAELPLRTLAQEESLPGYPPLLRIGPNIRVAVIDRLVVFYSGHGSEGVKSLFDAMRNPALSLAGDPAYQAARQGAEAAPGMGFTFVNLPRLLSLLDAAGLGAVTRVADSLGLSSAQAIGLAGGYRRDGMRHNLYIHCPGQRTGLLSALVAMPPDMGMEAFAQVIPARAEAFMALRLDIAAFLNEAPYFAESIGAIARPGGMGGYLANETILGVPLADIAGAVGGEVVIRPHDDTHIAFFNNVDVQAFESIVARMEQNAGTRFRALAAGNYQVRYFNQRAGPSLPLAPAFCLIPRQRPAGSGVLYAASHPQALLSLIRDAGSARETVAAAADFQKAAAGLDGNYSLFYYVDCRDSYRRLYNLLLPLTAVWSGSGIYPVDTGLLPPASAIMPKLFGCAVGVKSRPQGLAIQAYSPIGINALAVLAADKAIVSNPLVLGYVLSWISEVKNAVPAW